MIETDSDIANQVEVIRAKADAAERIIKVVSETEKDLQNNQAHNDWRKEFDAESRRDRERVSENYSNKSGRKSAGKSAGKSGHSVERISECETITRPNSDSSDSGVTYSSGW